MIVSLSHTYTATVEIQDLSLLTNIHLRKPSRTKLNHRVRVNHLLHILILNIGRYHYHVRFL